jgi:hypothetical protein
VVVVTMQYEQLKLPFPMPGEKCPICNGTGMIAQVVHGTGGRFVLRKCRKCGP